MADPVARLNATLSDRYHVERELGRGGMATVYLAEDLKHGRRVAMKVLLPELLSVVGAERFLREIEVEAALRHPSILPLLDSGEADGLLYYTMPYVEGESLRDRLRREKQLPIDDALRIAGEVAEALAYSHAQGVVHRDIKPSNVMLDSDHAFVTDFGIALVVRGLPTERLTQSGLSPGSPEYMSPEQAAGELDVDGRSDIYSLGCVLYEMLAGDPPFTGSIPQAILAKKLMEPVPSLCVVRDSVPEHVDQAVMISLAKSPADRLQTAEELGRALKGDFGERVIMASHAHANVLEQDSAGLSLAGLAAAVIAGMGALLATVGLLSTRVYDVKLHIPYEHTPSRPDFILVGAQALVAPVVYCVTGAILYLGVRFVVHVASTGLHRVPVVGRTLDDVHERTTNTWRSLWQRAEVGTVADVYLLGSVVVALLVLWFFRPLLAAMWSDDSEALSYASRSLHRTYYIVLPLLTAGLALAWLKFVRFLRERPVSGTVAMAKWGGLAWVILITIVMTLPWRLLYNNEHPRALLDGEQTYILLETEQELVMYRSRTGSTEQVLKSEAPQLERLGTSGYLFEGPESFANGGVVEGINPRR